MWRDDRHRALIGEVLSVNARFRQINGFLGIWYQDCAICFFVPACIARGFGIVLPSDRDQGGYFIRVFVCKMNGAACSTRVSIQAKWGCSQSKFTRNSLIGGNNRFT